MRLLDRYLLRELLVPLGYCLGGFLIFYSSFDLIFKLHQFQEKQMTLADCIEYYLVTLPETFVMLAPVTLLLALLFAVSNHARHHEFTAIRAAGVSLWRLSAPYMAVGAILTLFVFVVNEFWAPQTSDKVERIFQRHNGPSSERSLPLKFSNESAGRDWDIKSYNTQTGEMMFPTVIWRLPNGSRKDIYARSANFSNGAWEFKNVEVWTYKSAKDITPDPSTNAALRLPFTETPELIRSEVKVNRLELRKTANSAQLSIGEIFNYLRLHPKLSPSQRAILMTQLQGRIAAPFTCLTVVLIAMPFGARSGRRNVFVGVASSIVICFIYIVFQSVCLALGNGNWLPPVIAAWLPNAAFGTAGIVLISRVR